VKKLFLVLVLSFPVVLFGCGEASPDETAIDDPQAVPGPDGGEPVLSEEGP